MKNLRAVDITKISKSSKRYVYSIRYRVGQIYISPNGKYIVASLGNNLVSLVHLTRGVSVASPVKVKNVNNIDQEEWLSIVSRNICLFDLFKEPLDFL